MGTCCSCLFEMTGSYIIESTDTAETIIISGVQAISVYYVVPGDNVYMNT